MTQSIPGVPSTLDGKDKSANENMFGINCRAFEGMSSTRVLFTAKPRRATTHRQFRGRKNLLTSMNVSSDDEV